ncbi:MAG TPA: DNA translocase FtsK 4TM domain-containing protein, partial [Bacteroidales bacterium]|nr:DNA translocase FtsK 4TM domain-containing protein [Bacteroidales bacterium]
MSKVKDNGNRKVTKASKANSKSNSFFTDERVKFIFGILVTGFALYLLLACVAYLFWWKTDQSLPDADIISGADVAVKNWSGKSGHYLAKLLIGYGFGYGAFFIPLIFGALGLYLLNFPRIKPVSLIAKFAFAAIIISLILGFIFGEADGYLISGPGGAQGYLITQWLDAFMGMIGTGIFLAFLTISYLVFALHLSPQSVGIKLPSFKRAAKQAGTEENADSTAMTAGKETHSTTDITADKTGKEEAEIEFIVRNTTDTDEENDYTSETHRGGSIIRDFDRKEPKDDDNGEDIPINISRPFTDDNLTDKEVERMMGNYDPRLDLSHYKFPPVSILKEHKSDSAFDNTEVLENKENIIKTLGDHKIAIKSIAATVGPTVTLYEIVPERGVRLARIKSLEDDIALNLSALGIRIIAPIPGRGTVGIEVPNKNPEMVSMRSLITSKSFQ